MTIKELIEQLEKIEDKNRNIVVASDEEWNSLMTGIRLAESEDYYVIYGLTGTEVEEVY